MYASNEVEVGALVSQMEIKQVILNNRPILMRILFISHKCQYLRYTFKTFMGSNLFLDQYLR